MEIRYGGLNYAWFSFGGALGYIVYDNEGNEFFRGDWGSPDFTMISESLLRADTSGGIGMLHTRFFDVERGLFSPMYANVQAFDHGWVVYRGWGAETQAFDMLFAHDMFNPELNLNSFQRVFRTGAFGDHLLQEARFIYENTLFIVYYNSQNERIEETLVLERS